MSETQYEGGYRGATRESYYRGKKLGTTLKADTATDIARAKRDAAIVKDMLAQEKEVQAAWAVWDKNQDLLKKEAVDMWNTLTKIPDKVHKVMEARKTIIQDKEYDESDSLPHKETLVEKWGEDSVAPISNWNTLQLKSLIKDISKLYDIPFTEVNTVTSIMIREATPDAKRKHGNKSAESAPTWEEVME